jgi:3-isopropylmalate/(R)-2-methylmalate dehydratase small subunit
MEPFVRHTCKVVPYDVPNVDTDQIIPARFLKKIDRVGFGELLFHDIRFNKDGSPKPDFVLNDPRYKDGTVLVAGPQFGIGSSREHAPWALQQYGFRAVISSSFGDIFRSNCYQNGLLPVVLQEAEVRTLIERAEEIDNYTISIDLEKHQVLDSLGFVAHFDIDPFRRECMMQGLDDIGLTLKNEDDITQFEKVYA